MRRREVLAGLASLAAAPGAASAARGRSDTGPAETGRRAALYCLTRPEFMRYEVGDVRALHYAEVAASHGALLLATAIGDTGIRNGLFDRFERLKAARLPNSANHVDANVEGALLIDLGRAFADRAAVGRGLDLADGQWRDPLPSGLSRQARWWIDDVWMIGRLQLAAAAATGQPRYADRAGLMARLYLARLQQPNGLFHHGPDAPFFWGRGNGWVAAGLAEILAGLPPAHPDYRAVLGGYRRMMAALLRWQAPSGMWRQLIDFPDSWEESSATAMFAYAFALGRRRGLLADPAYRRAATRAWSALEKRVGSDGRLADICVGTGQSADAAYYLGRPRTAGDLHGQAALLWLASELARPPEPRGARAVRR